MNIQNFKGRRAIAEQGDNYPNVVMQQGAHVRIIRCRDGIQWIIQTRSEKVATSAKWTPRSYHRSKKSLIRRLHTLLSEIGPKNQTILDALPSWIEEGGVL
ncbi:MAG: hypothetical protein GY807_12235 [Gammaproteobacteria bacterium]|nr:hypothetical protein [Gammaproteobacteria bacterium]